MVVHDVRSACASLTERFPGLVALNMEKLTREERTFLLDAHIASVEQAEGKKGQVVILEPSAVLSIMINEEDHLRIQVLKSGLVLSEAWELADWVDDRLSEKLNFGYSARYGFLTASVSNVGTGLRLSAMMHLAGLALKGRLNAQLRAAYDLGVSVRGMFGEGTRSMGDLFQVSNEITLGVDERDIVERVSSVAQYLLNEERSARKELLGAECNRMLDMARKALGILRNARSIVPQEAITLMSPIRLAGALGLVENYSCGLFNELLVGMRVGAGQEGRANLDRATLLREKLADVRIAQG